MRRLLRALRGSVPERLFEFRPFPSGALCPSNQLPMLFRTFQFCLSTMCARRNISYSDHREMSGDMSRSFETSSQARDNFIHAKSNQMCKSRLLEIYHSAILYGVLNNLTQFSSLSSSARSVDLQPRACRDRIMVLHDSPQKCHGHFLDLYMKSRCLASIRLSHATIAAKAERPPTRSVPLRHWLR